ncbi:hypothetical protein [Roseateles asaccharophilus]|uniref:Uncharacterized protein n=1 Tax=Roseateles asaccharophilus TaxID=582607 RepID=A0ABU2A604_9BURK|nr:hypothetical protein [Roseateles asaccharophilus]MDR7332632.1 hypothetical protein [Roseateles asaccharophilus]
MKLKKALRALSLLAPAAFAKVPPLEVANPDKLLNIVPKLPALPAAKPPAAADRRPTCSSTSRTKRTTSTSPRRPTASRSPT